MAGTVRIPGKSADAAAPDEVLAGGAAGRDVGDESVASEPPAPAKKNAADATVQLSASDVEIEDIAPRSRSEGLVGRLVGARYRIEALIGEGGFGAVYRAEHVRMRKRVALKVLRPDGGNLPEMIVRFEREAVCGAHVQHPNVASATDFGQLEDGAYYLALEYVEGERLSDLIARGPLGSNRSARIARDIASALAAVHEKGIVHRDVKPENVMVGSKDRVKLIDFGLAKVDPGLLSETARTGAGLQLTAIGTVVGTVAYLAPEAALGMDAVDARGDLYALGLVLFEMLSGKRPFEGHDNVSLFRHQRFSPPPRVAERAPGVEVPAALEAIALRLLAKNPLERFPSAAVVVRAFDALLGPADERGPASSRDSETPSSTPSETPSIPGISRRTRTKLPSLHGLVQSVTRMPLWARGVVGGVAVLVVIITVAALNARSNHPPPASPSTGEPTVEAAEPAPPPPQAPPARVDGVDAAGWRVRLRAAVDSKDYQAGTRAFLALAEIDAPALDEPGLRGDVVAVAAGIAFEGHDLADRMFSTMADKLGSRGCDLLFEIIRARGATRAAHRAIDLLRKPEVIARATPEMRIAFELKMAPCDQKQALFDRAAAEGDGRALVQLEILKDQSCKRKDPCCFRESKPLHETIQKLKTRLLH